MIVSDRKEQLGIFLDLLGGELDPPEEVDRRLKAAYDELTAFLSDDPLRAEVRISADREHQDRAS